MTDSQTRSSRSHLDQNASSRTFDLPRFKDLTIAPKERVMITSKN
jgi:hypothetical protein